MGETTQKYELRALAAKDVFSMSRIIAKIGVNNFKKCFIDNDEVKKAVGALAGEGQDNEAGVTAVGLVAALEVANVLFEHLPDCEKEVYSFLADLSGLKTTEIQGLPMVEFFEMIVEVIRKPEFKDFFKVASRLFK